MVHGKAGKMEHATNLLNKQTKKLNRKWKKMKKYFVHMNHDPKCVQWMGGLAVTSTESNLPKVHLLTTVSVVKSQHRELTSENISVWNSQWTKEIFWLFRTLKC